MRAPERAAQDSPTGEEGRRSRVLLILPCYNESAVIGGLLQEIQELRAEYDTLVIDDGSLDGTYDTACPLSPCVRLVDNLGIGGAVHTGIKYALEEGYEFCAQVDGDGQHPPNQVARLLEGHRDAPANIVIGSRYIQEHTFHSTWARRLGSWLIRRWVNLLFGQKVTDPTSGLRLMDRKAMAFFHREYPHEFPEPVSLAKALRHGLSAKEVPVEMRSRRGGKSSIAALKTVAYMIRVLGYIVLIRFERRL